MIVSKPRLKCINRVINGLEQWKEQIMFRFTIGTIHNDISRFWEPGAPEPYEQVLALELAYNRGFRTSVSIEPMLEGYKGIVLVIEAVRGYITDIIWIGKMNKVRLRVADGYNNEVARIEELQCEKNILELYHYYKDDPMIRWKDSIKEVITKHKV